MLDGVTSRPASHNSTRVAGSSLSRAVSAHPAEPPPMIRKSTGSEGRSMLGDPLILLQSASPITKASAVLSWEISRAAILPIGSPSRARGTGVRSSAIASDRTRKPFSALGSIVTTKGGSVHYLGGHLADHHRSVAGGKRVRLYDDCQTRLAVVSRRPDDDHITAPHRRRIRRPPRSTPKRRARSPGSDARPA